MQGGSVAHCWVTWNWMGVSFLLELFFGLLMDFEFSSIMARLKSDLLWTSHQQTNCFEIIRNK